MDDLFAAFRDRHPECAFRALGAQVNAAALDLMPFGQSIEYLDAAAHPVWVERYQAANRACFPDTLSLPGWVLVDLYLMPAAIGLLTCPARLLDVRPPGLADDDEAVAAAYYAAPSIVRGVVVGVSLISLRKGLRAATWIKALTLEMLRARVQRGITQWDNPALRVHTRMGALRIEGPVPSAHGRADDSFLYAVELGDAAHRRAAMTRPRGAPAPSDARWIPIADRAALRRLLDRAAAGEQIEILPPGLSDDAASVLVRGG